MKEDRNKTLIIGERINPTGRKSLADELRKGVFGSALADAKAQADAGADFIDVNAGIAGVDEAKLLPVLVREIFETVKIPVCVDSSDPEAISAALSELPDGCMVNSVTGDKKSLDSILPVAAERSASVIGITKSEKGIPQSVEERLDMALFITESALECGIPKSRIYIDFCTMPVSVEPRSVSVTLDCIRIANERMGVGCILGASNISFGMPSRNILNASFLSIAINCGLNAAIINPLEEDIVQTILAADLLAGRDRNGRRYLSYYRKKRAIL